MTETEYRELTDAVFERIETTLDRFADHVDYQLAPGGVLEIEFADDSRIVINRQPATQEIWVAARSGGFHYRHVEGAWRDTRSGEELFAALAGMLSAQAGTDIALG
jgi:CyaY protein